MTNAGLTCKEWSTLHMSILPWSLEARPTYQLNDVLLPNVYFLLRQMLCDGILLFALQVTIYLSKY